MLVYSSLKRHKSAISLFFQDCCLQFCFYSAYNVRDECTSYGETISIYLTVIN